MATHILEILVVPKVVINKINSILSTFFWGEQKGPKKAKWHVWSSICMPVREGV